MVQISDDTFLSKDKVFIHWRRYWGLVQGIQSGTIQGAFVKMDALCLTVPTPNVEETVKNRQRPNEGNTFFDIFLPPQQIPDVEQSQDSQNCPSQA